MTQPQRAAELGMSFGGVNDAFKALIERGFVKANNFRKSDAKAAYLYMLTSKGVKEKMTLASVFLVRRLEECEALKQEIEDPKGEIGPRHPGNDAKSG